jgi:hypothetical protein
MELWKWINGRELSGLISDELLYLLKELYILYFIIIGYCLITSLELIVKSIQLRYLTTNQTNF